MAEIVLITGGAASGKSAAALRLAEGFEPRVLIATAEPIDEEMRERIARHRAERGSGWRTIEEPLDAAGAIASVAGAHAAVVFDCLTVWLGNLFHRDPEIGEEAAAFRDLLAAAERSAAARLVFVTHELGLGVVPADPTTRRFRDVLGRLNRRIAARAERVIWMVCGQALTIKPLPASGLFAAGFPSGEGRA